ncbi:hydrolase [Candidatus Marinamargulisbacteria bacterium SCGC AG-343-K17]|nr:hydrolase [Candidatus Marinamargulisbacteria bacterium SCGC AG-343-K17]
MDKKNRGNEKLSVTAIQLSSGEDVQKNLDEVNSQVDQLEESPNILVLPEVFNYRTESNHEDPYSEELDGKSIQFLKQLAKGRGMHIIGGSITETGPNNKAYNTTVVINDSGQVIGTYRKMHLFDVSLGGKSIRESNRYMSGNQPEIVDILGWKVGLSICYDLRFPELFRWYFKAGVDMVVIPSSFTYETGKKHWHILCQARAIENQCYVIAPNQCGIGANNTNTFGHSLIINPMGEIMAEADDASNMSISAHLIKSSLDNIRRQFPIQEHQRKELN